MPQLNNPYNANPPMLYSDGNPSSVGTQLKKEKVLEYLREALENAVQYDFLTQLANTVNMPKHMGKTVKGSVYNPILDDRNINDQGIDALGRVILSEVTIKYTDPNGAERYVVGNGTNATDALEKAKKAGEDLFKNLNIFRNDYDDTISDIISAGWEVKEEKARPNGGNLYGSSKDINYIKGKLPSGNEVGGRYNRVGYSRRDISATLQKFAFFMSMTKDAIDFDSDPELVQKSIQAIMETSKAIYEDVLQIDLLNSAHIVHYGGDAISPSTITGNQGETPSVLSYDMLVDLETSLNNSHCPKDTTIIKGSVMTDTRTISSARYVFIGSELTKSLLKLTDYHGNKAFIPVHEYADATSIAKGEIGAINGFRFIMHPRMLHWSGSGATVTTNDGYLESDGKYNVYPLLVVGGKSFSTVSFSTGKERKFQYISNFNPLPTPTDPQAEQCVQAVKWWYSFLALNPNHIACAKVVAEK